MIKFCKNEMKNFEHRNYHPLPTDFKSIKDFQSRYPYLYEIFCLLDMKLVTRNTSDGIAWNGENLNFEIFIKGNYLSSIIHEIGHNLACKTTDISSKHYKNNLSEYGDRTHLPEYGLGSSPDCFYGNVKQIIIDKYANFEEERASVLGFIIALNLGIDDELYNIYYNIDDYSFNIDLLEEMMSIECLIIEEYFNNLLS